MLLERSRLGLARRGVAFIGVLSFAMLFWTSSPPAALVSDNVEYAFMHALLGRVSILGFVIHVLLAAYVAIAYCAARGHGGGGITARQLYDQTSDWKAAVANSGMNPVLAFSRAFLWLVFFHLVPPLASFAALYSGWDLISLQHQRWLAGALAVRQALYLLAATIAAIIRPEYLLLSLRATSQMHGERMGWYHMLVYVTAPEKVVGMTLACGSREGRKQIVRAILFFDVCGVAALFSAFIRLPLLPAPDPQPLPLLLTYISVVVSAIGTFGLCVADAQARALKTQGWRMEEVKKTGAYTLADAREAGYTCGEIRAVGYTCAEARAAGYSCMEVKEAGYASKMLKSAGYSCWEAKEAGYVEGLRNAGYSIDEAKAAGFVEGLKRAGYSCKESKAAGFTPEECVRAGFALAEAKACGLVHDETTTRQWERAAKAARNR